MMSSLGASESLGQLSAPNPGGHTMTDGPTQATDLEHTEQNKDLVRQPTSFYDLFRVENGKIAEHWDTTETIPPREQWKNDNGKF